MREYHLRTAKPTDQGNLFALFCKPPVYEFLWDGIEPEFETVGQWFHRALKAPLPFGVWVLESPDDELLGVVSLKPVEDGIASAEVTYALSPLIWGKGIATSMVGAVISSAFRFEACVSILAGADCPNVRSFTVMKQLGMTFLREVEYPAGPGAEYLLTRSDFAAIQLPDSIPILAK